MVADRPDDGTAHEPEAPDGSDRAKHRAGD